MPEKICDFCGEPIAGGLQEHDLSDCAHYLKDKVAQLEVELDGWKTEAANRRFIYEKAKAENERLVNYLLKLRRKAELDYMGLVYLGVRAIDKVLGGE